MQKLYIIGPDTGPYKVGIAVDPTKRLSQLQTGNHAKLNIHFTMDHENAADLERRFHAAHANSRLQGEWFEAPLDIIREALEKGVAETVTVDCDYWLSPETFTAWLAEMKATFTDIKSDADCARLLGKTDDTIVSYKKKGTDRTVALACRALLHRLEPYGA